MLVLKQFLSDIVLKTPFVTAYITWSTYFLANYCFQSSLSQICDQEIIFTNYERPHVLLFTFFRRREVSIDCYLVYCHVFFLLLVKMYNESFFVFTSWLHSTWYLNQVQRVHPHPPPPYILSLFFIIIAAAERSVDPSVIMTKISSALKVLAKVNNVPSRNIEVHTNIET